MPSTVVLLGPQRFRPSVQETLRSLGAAGPVAAITAGWQERENEQDELAAHLQRDVVDLLLYHRYEDVLVRDRELAAALERRQATMQLVQELYRLRLGHALAVARELFNRDGGGPWLSQHRREAVHAVRTLDRQHVRRLRRIHEAFDERWQPRRRPVVLRHLEQLGQALRGVAALCIAGGHVAVLLNRMRLFGISELLGDRPVVAWSAGAMALSERVVLFHDSPPQGRGDPEVLDGGLGWCRGLVLLPHARRRLRLDDPIRCALFARRFSPATCVVLENPARIRWDGQQWNVGAGTVRIGRGGRLQPMAER